MSMINVHNFYVGDEKEICEEIRAWSAFALEKNHLISITCPHVLTQKKLG